MKNNSKKSGLIIFIIVIVLTAMTALGTLKCTSSGKKAIPSLNNGGYIAALYVEGVIQDRNQSYNQKWLLSTINSLKNDKANKAIAVFVDSPGGAVYEADEAYLALQDYRTSGKPVYVYQGPLAASGGYYISCAASKIYANRNTLTGSIGVITASSMDVTGLLEKLGIKSETIHSGRNKTMFNYNEPVTKEQREIMQTIADECYEQFTGIVAISRNIPLFEVKKLADGRIYTANQALHNGLIDKIDTWENMLTDMEENEFDGKTLRIKEFRYEKSLSMKDLLFEKSGISELSALNHAIEKTSLRYPAYLYEN